MHSNFSQFSSLPDFYFLPGSLGSTLYIHIVSWSARDAWWAYVAILWLCHFYDLPIKFLARQLLTPAGLQSQARKAVESSFSISTEFAVFTDNTAGCVFSPSTSSQIHPLLTGRLLVFKASIALVKLLGYLCREQLQVERPQILINFTYTFISFSWLITSQFVVSLWFLKP